MRKEEISSTWKCYEEGAYITLFAWQMDKSWDQTCCENTSCENKFCHVLRWVVPEWAHLVIGSADCQLAKLVVRPACVHLAWSNSEIKIGEDCMWVDWPDNGPAWVNWILVLISFWLGWVWRCWYVLCNWCSWLSFSKATAALDVFAWGWISKWCDEMMLDQPGWFCQ